MKILTQARIREEMEAYNADEVGMTNPITMYEAEIMLLNSDEFHNEDVQVEDNRTCHLCDMFTINKYCQNKSCEVYQRDEGLLNEI